MMQISNTQAQYLMSLQKKILVNESILDSIEIQQSFPINFRYELIAVNDDDYTFLWEIKQSEKNSLRLSLHYQENDSKMGLLRVDYNSGHKNPEKTTSQLPQMFIPYVGKWFEPHENHVHYHVEGYRSLAWAVPICDSNMRVRLLSENRLYSDITAAIIDFARIINIEIKLIINEMLL